MRINACCSIVKLFVFLFNFIFWLIGLIILALAIFLLTDPTYVVTLAENESRYYLCLYVVIAIGSIFIIVAILGCCGAIKESQCMLISFFCLLLCILVAQIAAGTWAFYKRDEITETIHSHVRHTVKEEYSVIPSRTYSFDKLQVHFECCGSSGPGDWAGAKYNSNATVLQLSGGMLSNIVAEITKPVKYTVPESCCKLNITRKQCDESRTIVISKIFNNNIYSEGCLTKTIEKLNQNLHFIFGAAIIIVAIELLELMLSLVLLCFVQRDETFKA